jgi:hypothetical protein
MMEGQKGNVVTAFRHIDELLAEGCAFVGDIANDAYRRAVVVSQKGGRTLGGQLAHRIGYAASGKLALAIGIDYIRVQGDGIPPSLSDKNRRHG